MSDDRLDPQFVQRLADLAGLSIDQARAERLAPGLAVLLRQADACRRLDLEGVEPAWSVQLEASDLGA